MVGAILLTALVGFQEPTPTRGFSYTGIPFLTGSGSEKVAVPSHSAIIELQDPKRAKISTTTVFKNTSNQALTLILHIPWRIAEPKENNAVAPRKESALWDGQEVALVRPMIFPPVETVCSVTLKPSATHSLKATVEVATGTTGFAFKQRIIGYALTGSQTIAQLNITYRYVGNLSGNTTFRLPTPEPKFPWQIGDRGAFVRLTNYEPKDELTTIAFYPGGFEDIGE